MVCYSFWDNIKANLILRTEVLSLQPYDIYLWMCFTRARFIRKADELCRVQENSLQIKQIRNSCVYPDCRICKLKQLSCTHCTLLYCNGYIRKIIKMNYFISYRIKHVLKLIICNGTLIKIKIHKTQPEILILVFSTSWHHWQIIFLLWFLKWSCSILIFYHSSKTNGTQH